MQYFRILADDAKFADRWFLDEPRAEGGNEIGAREFTYGRPYVGPTPVTVPIYQAGRQVEFLLAAFDMPVVSERVARLVGSIAPGEVECFPVTVDSTISGRSEVSLWLFFRCAFR